MAGISYSYSIGSEDDLVKQIHHSTLTQGLCQFLQDGLFCDVTLVTKTHRFDCHKLVLSSFSAFFKSMFTIGMKESKQSEIVLDIFEDILIRKMLNFIYNGTIILADMPELLPVAVYFQIESLQRVCEQSLSKVVTMDNVTNLWKTSSEDFPQLVKLKESCQNFLLQNFIKFTETQDFLELQSGNLVSLISNEFLQISSEEFLCCAVTRWFQHDFSMRKESMYDIFKHVHFPLLKDGFIEENFPFVKEPLLQSILKEANYFLENFGIQADFNSLRCNYRPCFDKEKVLLVLGYFENYSHDEDLWCYQYTDKTWQLLKPPGQQPRGYQTCTYKQSCLLLSGETEFCMFDGIKNCWSQLPDMEESRTHHCMEVVNNTVFVLGGCSEDRRANLFTLDSVSKFTPLDGTCRLGYWEQCGNLCHPVTKASSAISDAEIFVFSGCCEENPDSIYDTIQCFNTVTNACTVIDCVLPLGHSFNWLRTCGYGNDIYLTNAKKIWRFYGQKTEKDQDCLEELHTFESEGNLAGFVVNFPSLYLLGNIIQDSSNPGLTKGIVEFDLTTNRLGTLVNKALFLPSDCKCHNLVIAKSLTDNSSRSLLDFGP